MDLSIINLSSLVQDDRNTSLMTIELSLFCFYAPEKGIFLKTEVIFKNLNLKLIIEFFHLLIIPMTLFNNIMPYFDEFIHVYMLKYKYIVIPLKNLDAHKFYNCQF